MESPAVVQPVVLTSDAVSALPAVPLGDLAGVTHKVVWRAGNSMAGVLTVDAGHRLGSHAHRSNHHHIWVLSGAALVLGDLLEPGSYVHIPAGVHHDIDATGTSGCTVFYLYARFEG
jgi:quercetin dioxygenase-like cupin family protein